MKENWIDNIPDYFLGLAQARHSTWALFACFPIAIAGAFVNRWVYEAFPSMSLALEIPVQFVLIATFLAGLFAAAVFSFRYLRNRHAIFGVIGIVVLMTMARFAMANLQAAGLEPASGRPLFGAMLMIPVFGWIGGFLLALLERHPE